MLSFDRLRNCSLIGISTLTWIVAGAAAPAAESEGDRLRTVMLQAVACKPHPRQVAWQENEFTGFVHFGVNTFSGREWGTGMEDPNIFQPAELDTDQWCRAMKTAGMKLVVFTAKHHDGFCLWQTRYTNHSVASSSWRNGQGDVLRELSRSCKEFGLKLGVYLSPADLYQIENPKGLYGNLSEYSKRTIPRPVAGRRFEDRRTFQFEVDDYNEYFMNQLFELLTEYGPIHEVWFDGAHPKRKGGQKYTYNQWYQLIRELAPEAVIFGKGPDVRWVGNEAGGSRPAEWSVVPIGGRPDEWNWPDMTARDLGSLAKLDAALREGGFLHWYPAETDTSIRHGWFWRDEQQHVKPTEEILDIWYRAVGGNAVLLLNIPPNRQGRFADRDVSVLEEVGAVVRATFTSNLADGATASASASRGREFAASNILDGDARTCWMPPDWSDPTQVIITLSEPRTFNRVVLQEQIGDHSQRIERFGVDAHENGNWKQIAEGTTVGYKRICRTPTITTDRVRLRVLNSRVAPTISNFALYREPQE
jgi:alpha-L-fucosidase